MAHELPGWEIMVGIIANCAQNERKFQIQSWVQDGVQTPTKISFTRRRQYSMAMVRGGNNYDYLHIVWDAYNLQTNNHILCEIYEEKNSVNNITNRLSFPCTSGSALVIQTDILTLINRFMKADGHWTLADLNG